MHRDVYNLEDMIITYASVITVDGLTYACQL